MIRAVYSIDVLYVDGKDVEYGRTGKTTQMTFENVGGQDNEISITVGGHAYSVYLDEISEVIDKLRGN